MLVCISLSDILRASKQTHSPEEILVGNSDELVIDIDTHYPPRAELLGNGKRYLEEQHGENHKV